MSILDLIILSYFYQFPPVKSAGNTRLEALGEGTEEGGGRGVLEWLGLVAGLTIVSAGFHSSLAKLLAFCLFCFQNDKHTN